MLPLTSYRAYSLKPRHGSLRVIRRSCEDASVLQIFVAALLLRLTIAIIIFAPFLWQLTNFRQSITMPEMLVWWGCFPVLLIALWYAVRFKLRRSLPMLLFTMMFTLAYANLSG
jgi:hypothetical protein